MNHPVRVRFAPSPTGHLHIGGLRSAIFNWLFARHNNGAFLLRIEDTDKERSKPEYTVGILETFQWMRMESDEPVVIQSENLSKHLEVANQLIEEGKAYRCYCSNAHIQELKEEQLSEGKLLRYDGTCRNKVPSEQDANKPYAIRFKLPFSSGPITFDDMIHGPITIDAEQLEDFIIVRSDGTPMYNFVVVVDDATMKITHVIRGEEHIPNTPKQILLYHACGFTMPRFAHIPLILGPSGNKLSKRDAAVAVIDYRNTGYLPDALFNYLVRLGWAHGDQEIFSRDELVSLFKLEDVGKKGSIFDPAKLDWVNSVYIKNALSTYLLDEILQYVEPSLLQKVSHFSKDQILDLIDIYKERVSTLKQLVEEIILLHTGPTSFNEADIKAFVGPSTANYLMELQLMLETLPWEVTVLSQHIKQWCNQHAIKLPIVAQPIRLALTGKTASPGIFELLACLKKEESIRRLQNFASFVKKI